MGHDITVYARPNLSGRLVQTMEVMHKADDVARLDQFPAFEYWFVQTWPWGGCEAFSVDHLDDLLISRGMMPDGLDRSLQLPVVD